ncbi:MAG: carboxymuconolactone decarboxylase family protein [Candidatus Brocadiaceae bacterium]|nr:carboxymuconolactone decarboxylase family protein [Candidatus Brocadiaceae bacterium]
MLQHQLPKKYLQIKERHEKLFHAVDTLGTVAKQEGPLDEKTAQLIQLAAAASIKSEGSVHSHARRAIEGGATPEEIYHAIILLTSTIGFPSVVAALSWADDVLGEL